MDCDCCRREAFVSNTFDPKICRTCRHEEPAHQCSRQVSGVSTGRSDVPDGSEANATARSPNQPQPRPKPRPRPYMQIPSTEGATVQTNNKALTLRNKLEEDFKTARFSPKDGQEVAREIMRLGGSPKSLYVALDLPLIIERNKAKGDGSNDYLTMMSSAFDILEKYAVNLLKPNRPQYWRQIKYSNGVFQARVDCMAGARDILKQMGYSEEHLNGLAFPEVVDEPNVDQVSRVATDLLLARIEVDALNEETHPHPESLVNARPSVEMSLPNYRTQQTLFGTSKGFQSHMDFSGQADSSPNQWSDKKVGQVYPLPTDANTGFSDLRSPPVPAPRKRNRSLSADVQLTGQPGKSEAFSLSENSSNPIVRLPSNTGQPNRTEVTHYKSIAYPPDIPMQSMDMYASLSVQPQDTKPVQLQDTKPVQLQDTIPVQLQDTIPVQLQDIKPVQSQNTKPVQPQDTKICPKANCMKVFSVQSKFCDECGEPLVSPAAKPDVMTQKWCLQCQQEINSGANFCHACGRPATSTQQSYSTRPQEGKVKQPPIPETKMQATPHSDKSVDLRRPPGTVLPDLKEAPVTASALVNQWSCEYCTYLNDNSRRVCEMCAKTRSAPIVERTDKAVIPLQIPQATAEPQSHGQLQQQQQNASRVAAIQPQQSQKTQESYGAIDKQNLSLNLAASSVGIAAASCDTSFTSLGHQAKGVAAQGEKYQQLLNKGQQKEQYQKERKEQEDMSLRQGYDPNRLKTIDEQNMQQARKVHGNYSKDLGEGRERSSLSAQHDQVSFDRHSSRPRSSGFQIEDITDDPRSGFGVTSHDRRFYGSSGDQNRRSYLDDKERRQREMEEERQKEERRRQLEVAKQELEAIRRRDKQFFGFLKEGEKGGFEPEEVEIALNTVGNDPRGPIPWLVNELPRALQTIAQLAAKCGRDDYADWQSLGTFGDIETRKYFIKCQGDWESTIKAMCEARLKDIIEVRESVNVSHAAIYTALMESSGDVLKAIGYLQSTLLQPFVDRIWQEEQLSSDDESENDGLKRRRIPKKAKELVVQKDLNHERRVRVLYAEYNMFSWGRAELAIRLIDERDDQGEYNVSDVVDAVEAHQDYQRARDYLQQECPICFLNFPRDKMISMTVCQCSFCKNCLVGHFSIVIKEKSVKHMVCPMCGKPSMDDEDAVELHFQTLSFMLHHSVERELYDLLQQKLNDWNLMDDPNFRWCPHCQNGFVNEGRLRNKMTCPHCRKDSCFECKQKWEPQHDDLTCDEFRNWQIDNDPENQQRGLAAQLDRDGIDCPRCKFRYALAKGGCMHFKCTQCPHEFCSGCSQPYLKAEACQRFDDCRTRGLHAHHPRDCLFFLRDNSIQDLQQLLKMHNIEYNTEIPPAAGAQDEEEEALEVAGAAAAGRDHGLTCTVTEQKETPDGLQDEPCGRVCKEGLAGLCELHYKEYLVQLINVNNIDPIDTMNEDYILPVLRREKKEVPARQIGESDADYVERLRQYVKNEIHLQQRDGRGVLQGNV